MKIEVVEWNTEGEKTYKIRKMDYCCKSLEKSNIKLEYEVPESLCHGCEKDDCTDCEELYIEETLAMMISDIETIYDHWDNYTEEYTHFYPIKYCPFCGEPVEIVLVKTEDKTIEYQSLSKEREELNKKRRETDSIKRQHELDNLIRELDRKIESYFILGEENV